MIVGANHLTFLDLAEDGPPPVPSPDQDRYVAYFIPLVVELKDNYVGFSAVDAGMHPEIFEQALNHLLPGLPAPLGAAGVMSILRTLVIRRVV